MKGIDKSIALHMYKHDSTEELLLLAEQVKKETVGSRGELCSIINAKSGDCSEDCRYCAQSVHYQTPADTYDLLDYKNILETALKLEEQGVHRFSLVTSGRGPDDQDFEKLLEIYRKLSHDTGLKLCASHGIINKEQAKALKESGVSRYHHNLETSKEYYKNIAITHVYQDRVDTILACQAEGLEVCSGGSIGLGESVEDRIDMAFALRDLKIKSIPINILMPVDGTALGQSDMLDQDEILKSLAIVRMIIPEADLRIAGGRTLLGQSQERAFSGGVNAALVGNYLTTIGSTVEEDIQIMTHAGIELK